MKKFIVVVSSLFCAFSALAQSNMLIQLSWDTETNNVIRYELWSTTNLSQPMQPFLTVPAEVTSIVYSTPKIANDRRFYSLRRIESEPNKQKVSLAWDASTLAFGYRIYYGSQTRAYTNVLDVGNVLFSTVSNLNDQTTYYFAATTLDWGTLESDFSNEIFYLTPNYLTKTNGHRLRLTIQ